MAKELVIMPNWLGDCVLALSVVHRKITMQHTSLTLLVPQPLVPLCAALCGHPIIPINRSTREGYVTALDEVRKQRFDAVYVLPPSFSSALFAFRTRIKKRRGISGEWRRPLLTSPLPRSLRNVSSHLTYEYAMVLETDYVPPEYWQGVKLDKHDDYAGRIVFCPGSKYGPAKQWNGFPALAELLPGKEIVVLGDEGDAAAAEAVEAAGPERVKNLAGKTSLVEAARIISHARVVVANDSGLMHCAGFTGTPVVGIFGSTAPAWTRPLGAKVRIAHVKTDCSPCFKRTCRYNDNHCLTRITPDLVLGLMHQLVPEKL
ncbi:MAG TPA: lipopolysaccharide heptosyltransferase II [Chitinivibrionales bacterium]|nr:lipopolysaccharide heptosyltransferase II [Chitinivibrionales bacterium]